MRQTMMARMWRLATVAGACTCCSTLAGAGGLDPCDSTLLDLITSEATGVEGGAAVFHAESPGFQSVQWFLNGRPIGTGENFLLLANLTLADDGAQITIAAENECGSFQDGPAILHVQPKTTLTPLQADSAFRSVKTVSANIHCEGETDCVKSDEVSSTAFGPFQATASDSCFAIIAPTASQESTISGAHFSASGSITGQPGSAGCMTGANIISATNRYEMLFVVEAPLDFVMDGLLTAACEGCPPPGPHPKATWSLSPAGEGAIASFTAGGSSDAPERLPISLRGTLQPGPYVLDVEASFSAAGDFSIGFPEGFAHFEFDFDVIPTGDLNGDGAVDGADLGQLLAAWGDCPARGECPADLTGDGTVDGADLGALLASWTG
jgi:hypothetical protein